MCSEYLKLIESLKEQVAFLESLRSPIAPKESKESHTDGERSIIHMTNEHSMDKLLRKNPYSCNVCGKFFYAKWEDMAHRRDEHPTTLRTCIFFLQGSCAFEDKECWFKNT